MRRYLIVANRTLAGEALLHAVRAAQSEGECAFHIVVPATPPSDGTWTEGESVSLAEERMRTALDRLRGLGANITGEVGDHRPMLAVTDAIREQAPFDEIIVSTLPAGMSRWLRQDLPHRVERETGLPVKHVIAESDEVSRAS